MKQNKLISWETLLFMLYTLMMVFTVFKHEPWRDEAQVWLIVRDLPFSQIFGQMAYEGTPGLWHLLLFPFVKLGFPYFTMNLINLGIICLAAAVFIYKSPFSLLTKALFSASYYMAWEYAIIARSYGLSVLLLFLIAALYAQRFRKPIIYAGLIFLLFNTNVHSCFIALSLAAGFLWENYKNKQVNKQTIISGFIMFGGAMLALLQLLSSKDNMNYGLIAKFDLNNAIYALRYAFFPCLPEVMHIGFILGMLILISAAVYFYKNSRTVFFIALSSYFGLFYLFMFKGIWGYRHCGFIILILIFGLWLSRSDAPQPICLKKSKSNRLTQIFAYQSIILALNVCLAISFFPAAARHYQEYKLLFSGSKKMAQYLKDNKLTKQIIVAHESAYALALLPYLPDVKFWYADIEQYATFITWNNQYRQNSTLAFAEIEKRINKHNFSQDNTLLLLNSKIPKQTDSDYKLLYKVDTGIFGYSDEKYYLYKCNSEE